MATMNSNKLCVILLLVVLAILCRVGAASQKANRGYRCFRPFDALASFTPKDMKHRDNCVFDYLAVEGANASLHCGAKAPQGLDKEACYVKLQLNMSVMKQLADDSLPRYTLELRALNNSVVTYKGMDGNGYSVCCAMVSGDDVCKWTSEEEAASEEEGANVSTRQVHVPVACPLMNGVQLGASDSKLMSGAVMKPLHRPIAGAWEAKITFKKKGDVVGQLKIPFSLQRHDLTDLLGGMAEAKALKKMEEEATGVAGNTAVAVVENTTETESGGDL